MGGLETLPMGGLQTLPRNHVRNHVRNQRAASLRWRPALARYACAPWSQNRSKDREQWLMTLPTSPLHIPERTTDGYRCARAREAS